MRLTSVVDARAERAGAMLMAAGPRLTEVADPSLAHGACRDALAAPMRGSRRPCGWSCGWLGETGFGGIDLAMATISTSGICPDGIDQPGRLGDAGRGGGFLFLIRS